jgi:predicted transcriptional regulator
VLPREDYERLARQAAEKAEDIGTARLVNQARASIAAGEPVLPKEIVDRLAAGENPIRAIREWRGMTQKDLALQGGITQGYLSDLESGRRRGPAVRLRGISRVLKVPLDLLVE